MNQNVVSFYISMYKVLFKITDHVFVAITELLQNIQCLKRTHSVTFIDHFFKSPIIAILHNDVEIFLVITNSNIIAFNNIRMIHLSLYSGFFE